LIALTPPISKNERKKKKRNKEKVKTFIGSLSLSFSLTPKIGNDLPQLVKSTRIKITKGNNKQSFITFFFLLGSLLQNGGGAEQGLCSPTTSSWRRLFLISLLPQLPPPIGIDASNASNR
jgi:hypothetical protein